MTAIERARGAAGQAEGAAELAEAEVWGALEQLSRARAASAAVNEAAVRALSSAQAAERAAAADRPDDAARLADAAVDAREVSWVALRDVRMALARPARTLVNVRTGDRVEV